MKKKGIFTTIIAVFVLVFLVTTILSSFGSRNHTAAPVPTDSPVSPVEPVSTDSLVSPAEPAVPPAAAAEPSRQDGERFEDTIMIEGMEEAVRYEHIRSDAVGIEMDYDYEKFVRRSGPDRERFISIYDNPENPMDYLEITYRAEDADTAAASISDVLSQEYDLSTGPRELKRAGSCLWIEASVIKGTNNMADKLQIVYIIPASDGCRVATEYLTIEAAEGFGRRFSYMLNTLSVIDRTAGKNLSATGTWQTASMGYEDNGIIYPLYHVRFTDTDVIYGHLKNGEFVPDHSDKIISLGQTAAGGFRIQAEAANGTQYTYQTSESDSSVLEYYETWNEADFPEMYRGGASLSKSL